MAALRDYQVDGCLILYTISLGLFKPSRRALADDERRIPLKFRRKPLERDGRFREIVQDAVDVALPRLDHRLRALRRHRNRFNRCADVAPGRVEVHPVDLVQDRASAR